MTVTPDGNVGKGRTRASLRRHCGVRIAAVPALLVLSVLAGGCATHGARSGERTVRFESEPAGALVMFSPHAYFTADHASVVGETPGVGTVDVPPSGASVQLTRRGYEAWEGRVTADTDTIRARLVPLSEEEETSRGWSAVRAIDRLVVAPVRVGTQEVGGQFQADAPDFRTRFVTTFTEAAARRLDSTIPVEESADLSGQDDLLNAVNEAVERVDVATLASRPTPVVVTLPESIANRLAAMGRAVLILRAEGWYESSGMRVARIAVPVLMTAAAIATGAAVAVQGSGWYVVPVYASEPKRDSILAQAFLILPQTRQLLWAGQVIDPRRFDSSGAVEDVARALADQLSPQALGRDGQ